MASAKTSTSGTKRNPKSPAKAAEALTPEEEKQQTIERIMALAAKADGDSDQNNAAVNYSPTPDEQEALKGFGSSGIPEFKKLPVIPAVIPNHPSMSVGEAVIARSLGITDKAFYKGALRQLVNASSEGQEIDVEALNFAVSLVRSVEPANQLETMLAIQMAAVHLSSMAFARKMNHTQTIQQLDVQDRVVNKLMRTFTTQMEALRKLRNGGTQRVTVKHVHVHEGGQAIVGNVSHGGRPISKGVTQSHEQSPLSLSVSAALQCDLQEDEATVPSSSRAQ